MAEDMVSAHDCPDCGEELSIVDDVNRIFECQNCEEEFYGTKNKDGDFVIVGRC